MLKAFEATGIQPPNANVILDRFKTTIPLSPATPPEQTETTAASTELDWLKTKTLLQSVVKDNRSPEAKALQQQVHHLHVHLELTRDELQGAINTMSRNKSKKKKKTTLPLYSHCIETQGGSKWWSPRAKREADARYTAFQAEELAKEAAKATKREIQHQKKLLEEKQKEEGRMAREAAKVVRDQAKAEKRAAIDARKAERERQKQLRNAEKSIHLPKQNKRKASRQLQPETTKRRSSSAVRSQVVAHKPPSAPLPTIQTRSRKIVPPKRHW